MSYRRGRDRDGGRGYGGGMDGLLGEGPGGSAGSGLGAGLLDPMMNNQVGQLLMAQQLLQKQAALTAGLGGLNSMGLLQQQQQQMQYPMGGGGGSGDYRRKRSRDYNDRNDMKRQRRDSAGRSGDHDRFHRRDSSRGEGRDRSRSSRWESDKKREKKENTDDYDPAEPTEDEIADDDKSRRSQDKDSGKDANNRYCHVCNVSVYDEASFRRHLNGVKHQQRMSSVLTVHSMKSSQLQSRAVAQEHLRKIEGKAGGFDPDYFCKVCNNDLTIPWERHRYSKIHKQRQLQVKRGCGWCNVHDFSNFTDVLDHRETEEHKKKAELHGKKDGDSKDRKKEEEEEEEDLTIPEFDAENAVGLKYIVPVTGYFCKLCNKFYNNEKSAKGAHCKSEAHYEKFKAATEEKIAEREKKKEEAAAAAALAEAEREKKRQEEGGEEEEEEEEMENEEEEEGGKEEKKEGKGRESEADYDDALPVEDSDDEGGLVQLISDIDKKDDAELNESMVANNESALDGSAVDDSALESSAVDNSALDGSAVDSSALDLGSTLNASELNESALDETASHSFTFVPGTEAVQESQGDSAAVEEVSAADVEIFPSSQDSQASGQVDDTVVVVPDEEESGEWRDAAGVVAATAPVTTKPTRRGGTARRARGRGRGKK